MCYLFSIHSNQRACRAFWESCICDGIPDVSLTPAEYAVTSLDIIKYNHHSSHHLLPWTPSEKVQALTLNLCGKVLAVGLIQLQFILNFFWINLRVFSPKITGVFFLCFLFHLSFLLPSCPSFFTDVCSTYIYSTFQYSCYQADKTDFCLMNLSMCKTTSGT